MRRMYPALRVEMNIEYAVVEFTCENNRVFFGLSVSQGPIYTQTDTDAEESLFSNHVKVEYLNEKIEKKNLISVRIS